jgi:hypothetical protein
MQLVGPIYKDPKLRKKEEEEEEETARRAA